MAKSAEDKSAVPVTVQFRPNQVDFIERAAKSAGKVRTVFLREAMLSAAVKQLGEAAPEAQAFEMGAQTPLSLAAKKEGISTRELTKRLAMQALENYKPGKPITTRERVARMKARAAKKK
jgi:uncharacterized protein (DUF1778 family)